MTYAAADPARRDVGGNQPVPAHAGRPAAEASATAQLSVGAGGNIAVLAYTWTHPDDGAQDGLLVLGPDESPGEVVALWGDSWHPEARGQATARGDRPCTRTVGYAYAEGWEWRITLTADRPDMLRWRMDNVVTVRLRHCRASRTGRWTASCADRVEPTARTCRRWQHKARDLPESA